MSHDSTCSFHFEVSRALGHMDMGQTNPLRIAQVLHSCYHIVANSKPLFENPSQSMVMRAGAGAIFPVVGSLTSSLL